MEPRDVRAAGAVVTRKGGEVLLVHRPKYDDWSFPKGKLDRGEHVVTAAVREVAEETGLDVRLGPALSRQRYRMSNGRWKAVDYWTARVAGSDDVSRYRPNDEIDAVEWVDWKDAQQRLTYPYDRDTLAEARPLRRRTRALVVLRHAEARSRNGVEEGRPAATARPARGDPVPAAGAAPGRLRRHGRPLLLQHPLRADGDAVRRRDRLAGEALRRAERGGRHRSRASSTSSTACSTATSTPASTWERGAVHPPAGAADRARRAAGARRRARARVDARGAPPQGSRRGDPARRALSLPLLPLGRPLVKRPGTSSCDRRRTPERVMPTGPAEFTARSPTAPWSFS